MGIISTGDLALLRADGHYITTYASILVPRDLWSARVNNGSAANGDTAIVFDAGSGLDFTAVEAVQEVWVGSTVGADDIGRVRIKSITSGDGGVTGTLTASPNSLNWIDNAFLTFKHDYPLKPKFPFIETDGTFKKDGDIAYSDQNSQPSPICIAGNHRAKFIISGSAVFNVDLTNSYAVASGATISSYTTAVYPTTGVTVSVTAGVGTITFTTAGQFWVKFSCTDSNGKTQTTYRSYWVHSIDKTSSDYPFVDFTIGQMTGDWDRGGWECGINVTDNATLSEIPDKALIVVWGNWWYGVANSPITFLPDDDNAIIVGYVRKYQQTHDLEGGDESVDFQVTTAEAMLRQKYDFSVSLEAVSDAPDKWYEYEEWLTVGRALHHLYKHHSTLFEVADVLGLLDNTDKRAYAEMEDGTLYAMGDSFARDRGTRQHLTCDRGGILRLVAESQILIDSDRATLTEVAEILKTDRSGPITIVGEPENRVAFVHISGFSWDGTFDADGKPNANAICAIAPGDKPDDDGPSLRQVERQTFTGQTQANKLAGRVYAMENNPFREIRINFHGNYLGVLEPCLGEYWKISLLAAETPREIVWTDKKLYLKSVTAQFDHTAGRISVSAVFEPEADGNDGKSTDCPTFPDFGGDFDIPAYDDQGGAIATASSFDYKPPSKKAWTQHTAEATEHAWPDPFWTTTQNSFASKNAIIWRCGVGYVKRSTDGGVTWTAVTPSTDPPNDAGDSPAPVVANLTFVQGEASHINDQEHVVIARWQNATNEWRSWLAYTDDDGATWSWVTVGGGTSALTIPALTADNTKNHPDSPVFLDMGNDRIIVAYATDVPHYSIVLIDTVNGTISDTEGSGGSLLAQVVAVAKLTSTRIAVVSEDQDAGSLVTAIFEIESDLLVEKVTENIYINLGSKFATAVSIAKRSDTEWVIATNIDSVGADVGTVMACSYDGVSTITVGAATVFNNEATPYLLLLDGVVGIHLYWQDNSLTNLIGTMITGTGTTITKNSDINILTNSVSFIGAAIVSGDKALVAYADSADSDNLWCRIVTLATGSAVMGTDYEIKNAAVTAVYVTSSGTDAGYVAYRHGTNTLSYVSFTTSGHTVTFGAEVDFPFSGGYPVIGYIGAGVVTAGYDANSSDTLKVNVPGAGSIKALGLSIGKALSETAYVTGWAESDELVFAVFDLLTVSRTAAYSLGAATEAELDADTYVAYPYAPFGIGDEFLYIFGRMSPTGLGISHVIYSEDSGASFTAVENGFGSDHCGSLIEDFGTVFAIRNISGANAKLYSGTNAGLTVQSTLLGVAGVNPSAMVYDWFNNVIYVGLDTGSSIMVLRSNAPFTEWVDITYDHQIANGVKAIMVL